MDVINLPENPGLTVLNLSNASDAKLKGHLRKLTLNLKNSSSVKKNIINKRYGLSCDECEVSMEGASDIKQDVL